MARFTPQNSSPWFSPLTPWPGCFFRTASNTMATIAVTGVLQRGKIVVKGNGNMMCYPLDENEQTPRIIVMFTSWGVRNPKLWSKRFVLAVQTSLVWQCFWIRTRVYELSYTRCDQTMHDSMVGPSQLQQTLVCRSTHFPNGLPSSSSQATIRNDWTAAITEV